MHPIRIEKEADNKTPVFLLSALLSGLLS